MDVHVTGRRIGATVADAVILGLGHVAFSLIFGLTGAAGSAT